MIRFKLSKKIALLLSVGIMTFVTSISSMQTLASGSKYTYTIFSTKTYMSDYVKGAEITVRNAGQSVYEYNGVYNYLDSENHFLEVVITTRIDFEKLSNDGTNSIYFSDDTTGFVYDVYGSIGFSCDMYYTSAPLKNLNMYLKDLKLNIYGQPYDIPYNSDSGFEMGGSEIWVPMGTLVYVNDIPETKRLSTNDVEIQATFLVSFTQVDFSYEDKAIIIPRMRYFVDGLRFYELFDEELSALKEIKDSLDRLSEIIQGGSNSSDMNNFVDSSTSQSGDLGTLNQQAQVDKIDINSASSVVDGYIDMGSVGEYGTLLSALTNNGRVVQMLLISLSVALVGYIFFGKR